MTMKDLENALRGAALDDLLLGGFIDQEEIPVRFRALRTSVYLAFGSQLVRFAVIESSGTMSIKLVDAVHHEGLDEDMTPAVTSIREEILDDSIGTNQVVAIRLWGAQEEQTCVRCGAAEIELANGQSLFLDPTYHFGIRLGSADQKRLWFENWPGATDQSERALAFAPS